MKKFWGKVIMKFKTLLVYVKYGWKVNSDRYTQYLRKNGIKIGNDVHFYSPWTISVDIQRPWMIEIGDNVHITAGCRILQHGYDWCVLQKKYGDVLGSAGKVKIGNNVFVGTETTILKGVTIGDDVIIGAKSLVNKDCLEPGVYAGNPVRFIMSLEDYHNKRKSKQIFEAKELVAEYYKRYNKIPEKELLREFFWLFEDNYDDLNDTYKNVFKLQNNEEFSKEVFKNHKKEFDSYESFVESVVKELEN